MNENIIAQYEALINYLSQYRKWDSSIRSRAFFPYLRVSWKKVLIWNFFKLLKKIDFLCEKQDSEFIEIIKSVASEKEKKSEFFKIRTSDYIIDAFSRNIEINFPQVNFAQLRKLHEQQSKKLIRWNFTSVFGIVFGLGTLFMRTVPKPFINQFNWNYEVFQIYTFWVMIAFIVYLGLALSPMIIKYHNAKRINNWIGEILNYTEIRINP